MSNWKPIFSMIYGLCAAVCGSLQPSAGVNKEIMALGECKKTKRGYTYSIDRTVSIFGKIKRVRTYVIQRDEQGCA